MTTAQISGSSTMNEVLDAYPGAQRALMRKYHIGGCSSCGFAPDEKLNDVLSRHNVLAVDEVIDHIKDAHEQERQMMLSPQELSDLIKGDNPPKLIDIREPFEQDIAKIDGALPGNQALVQEMMTSWDKATPIVTYCHHGVRSLEAASYLIGHGFTNVRSLDGGIDAWAEQIDTTLERY